MADHFEWTYRVLKNLMIVFIPPFPFHPEMHILLHDFNKIFKNIAYHQTITFTLVFYHIGSLYV